MSGFASRSDLASALDFVWGAKAISAFCGCGVDMVYGLAQEPGSPIRKVRGRLYASRAELHDFLRGTKPQTP